MKIKTQRHRGHRVLLHAFPLRPLRLCVSKRQVVFTEKNVMQFGIKQTRRGGLTRGDVDNTRSWEEMKKLFG